MIELPFITLEQAYVRANENVKNLDRAAFLDQVRALHGAGNLKITGVMHRWVSLAGQHLGPAVQVSQPIINSGIREKIPPEDAVNMRPIFDRGGQYTNGRIYLTSRTNLRWKDLLLEAKDVDRLWPRLPAVTDLAAVFREEIERNKGPISQKCAEKIARYNGAIESREKIREMLKLIQGDQKSGPKGPRKNRAMHRA